VNSWGRGLAWELGTRAVTRAARDAKAFRAAVKVAFPKFPYIN